MGLTKQDAASTRSRFRIKFSSTTVELLRQKARTVREVGLEAYFREINEVDLLTPEQEIELAHKIRAGDPAAREHMNRAAVRRKSNGRSLRMTAIRSNGWAVYVV